MPKFNEELVQAGAFIAADGFTHVRRARGACVGGKPNVTDGACTKAKAVIGG